MVFKTKASETFVIFLLSKTITSGPIEVSLASHIYTTLVKVLACK